MIVGDRGAIVDEPQGPGRVFKDHPGLPQRIARSVRGGCRQEITAGRGRAKDRTGDVTRRERIRNIRAHDRAGVHDRDRAGDRVVSGATGLQPRRNPVARREEIRPVAIVLEILGERPDRGLLKRLVGDRPVLAAREIAGRLPFELLVVVEESAEKGQLALNQRTIQREGTAEGAVLIRTDLHFTSVVINDRLAGSLIDDTRRRPQAKEQGVRAAGDFDRLGVVSVEGNARIGREVIDRSIRRRQTAHAVGLGISGRVSAGIRQAGEGVLGHATTVIDEGRVRAGALGARFIPEHVIDVEGGSVHHLLFRHHRDRRGQIAEVGVQTAACEGVFGIITLGCSLHLEGAHLDHLIAGTGSRRSRLRGHGLRGRRGCGCLSGGVRRGDSLRPRGRNSE